MTESAGTIEVEVEVVMHGTSSARPSEVKERVTSLLEKAHRGKGVYVPGNVTSLLKGGDKEFLGKHVSHARICEIVAPAAVAAAIAGGPTATSDGHASSSSMVAVGAHVGSGGAGAGPSPVPKQLSSSNSVYLPCVSFWSAQLVVYVYQLSEDGASDEGAAAGGGGGGEGGETDVLTQYTQWNLPAKEFEGTWEALIYDDDDDEDDHADAGGVEDDDALVEQSTTSTSSSPTDGTTGKRGRGVDGGSSSSAMVDISAGTEPSPKGRKTGSGPVQSTQFANKSKGAQNKKSKMIGNGATGGGDASNPESSLTGSRLKPALLQYAASALMFSDAGVDTSLIAWNHVILLHGPPGTGKTSLCKALAHKLSIRLADHFPSAQLIEINAHSLFSRWFSESGKLVHRLFSHISEMVDDEESLVFLLIDEVESLTAARKAAVSGSEPSDAVRVVNAVLTAIDSFRTRKNVLLLTTSNVSEAIDVAFVDRADIKAHVGPPGKSARYDIMCSCVKELVRVGLVKLDADATGVTSSASTNGVAADPGGANTSMDISIDGGLVPTSGSGASAPTTAASGAGAAGVQSSSNTTKSKRGHVAQLVPSVRLATPVEVKALVAAHARAASVAAASSSSAVPAASAVDASAVLASVSSSAGVSPLEAELPVDTATSLLLWQAASMADGLSGRTLRKLPLQAHAMHVRQRLANGRAMATAMLKAVQTERSARADFSGL